MNATDMGPICVDCNGEGVIGMLRPHTCPACEGTGHEPLRCSACHELGGLHDEDCIYQRDTLPCIAVAANDTEPAPPPEIDDAPDMTEFALEESMAVVADAKAIGMRPSEALGIVRRAIARVR